MFSVYATFTELRTDEPVSKRWYTGHCRHSELVIQMEAGHTPVFLNLAYLWLLPTGVPPDVIFIPSDTRPLSEPNADANICGIPNV